MAEIQLPIKNRGGFRAYSLRGAAFGQQFAVLRVLAEPAHDVGAGGTDLPLPGCTDVVHGLLPKPTGDPPAAD